MVSFNSSTYARLPYLVYVDRWARRWGSQRTITRLSRLALLACLAMAGCSDPVDDLVEQLSAPDVARRRTAAQQLGELRGDAARAIPALGMALSDEDREVRRLAAHALGEIGPVARASLPFLISALADEEQSVRLATAFAIAKIDAEHRAYVPILEDAMRAGDGGVIVAVGQMGEQAEWAVPILVALLQRDRRPGIRRIAAEALQQSAAVSQLARRALETAAREDENDRVREVAAGEVD